MDDSQLVEMTRASNQIFGSYPKVGGSNPSPAISNHQIGPSQDGPFCCPWGDERCSTRSSTELISFPMLTKCSQISKNAPLQRLGRFLPLCLIHVRIHIRGDLNVGVTE